MAYTFSRVDPSALVMDDLRPLIESSFHQLLQNMKFPAQADTDALKIAFLEQTLEPLINDPTAFIMRIDEDDHTVSYNIGYVENGIYSNRFTFLRPNKAGSLSWAYDDQVSQARYNFLTSEGVTRVRGYFATGSNIPAAMAQLSCYELETATTIPVKPLVPGWSFEAFERQVITYLLVDPSTR
jgi:hypothetical protein